MTEHIDVLANTGLSFYVPPEDVRFSDTILGKTWHFRVLQAADNTFRLEEGTQPLANLKTSAGQPLADIGSISILFRDAVYCAMRRWLPLPYGCGSNSADDISHSCDWIRLCLTKPPLHPDPQVIRLVFAVDSTVHPAVDGKTDGSDQLGFRANEVGLTFHLDTEARSFWRSPTLVAWVKGIFRDINVQKTGVFPAETLQLAAYLTLLEGFRQAGILPKVSFLHPEGQDIDVHLVLDLGNSRACGILVEHQLGQPIRFDECRKLEIRDISDIGEVSSEPFDTSFKFQPPLFFDPDQPILHAGTSFHWPSIVRLGREAAKLDPCHSGETGMSSPKRYLWDDQERPFPWYFHLPGATAGRKISANFLNYLENDGKFNADKARPPFDPCYPAGAMMTFVLLELLNHAYAQINSFNHRQFRGFRAARRVLRSLVLMVPNGISSMEQERYRGRIADAVATFAQVWQIPEKLTPRVYLDLDEATSVQLTYLYGEIREHFLGQAKEMIEVRGSRQSNGVAGFRLASIDIGGGTTDLMIAEYQADPTNPHGVRQQRLFSEGFGIAGDEICKRIIEKLILPRIYRESLKYSPNIAWEEFQAFFGEGRAGRDRQFLDRKAELARQVWNPMAQHHLAFAESGIDENVIDVPFDRFFPERQPGRSVLDFFSEQMLHEFGVDLSLADIPWRMSRRNIDSVILNVMETVLKMFAEVISQYSCDCIILGGRPSGLPIIRDLLARLMPVFPHRIIPLKNYGVGAWYPFARRAGGIADPKTTCVVGGAVWLFAECLGLLHELRLTTDHSAGTPGPRPFIGVFNRLSMNMETALFSNETGGGTATLPLTGIVPIGMRNVDSVLCPVNPLYVLQPTESTGDTARNHARDTAGINATLVQDRNHPDQLKVQAVNDNRGRALPLDKIRFRLQTMLTERYWLDSGDFDL